MKKKVKVYEESDDEISDYEGMSDNERANAPNFNLKINTFRRNNEVKLWLKKYKRITRGAGWDHQDRAENIIAYVEETIHMGLKSLTRRERQNWVKVRSYLVKN